MIMNLKQKKICTCTCVCYNRGLSYQGSFHTCYYNWVEDNHTRVFIIKGFVILGFHCSLVSLRYTVWWVLSCGFSIISVTVTLHPLSYTRISNLPSCTIKKCNWVNTTVVYYFSYNIPFCFTFKRWSVCDNFNLWCFLLLKVSTTYLSLFRFHPSWKMQKLSLFCLWAITSEW